MRHMSRTHRVDLDRICYRINLDPMSQRKYVNRIQQLADILTKREFTRDRWTKLTLLVNTTTHTTLVQSNLSVSSAIINPLFFSMSKRARDSPAASASAKQKPVHCAAMIARKSNDNNADENYHAAPPTENQAGGDSVLRTVSARSPKFHHNIDWSSIKPRATGSHERSVKRWWRRSLSSDEH